MYVIISTNPVIVTSKVFHISLSIRKNVKKLCVKKCQIRVRKLLRNRLCVILSTDVLTHDSIFIIVHKQFQMAHQEMNIYNKVNCIILFTTCPLLLRLIILSLVVLSTSRFSIQTLDSITMLCWLSLRLAYDEKDIIRNNFAAVSTLWEILCFLVLIYCNAANILLTSC